MMATFVRIHLLQALLLLLFTCASAYRTDFTPNSEEVNRVFFYSSSSPITRSINRHAPSVTQHVGVILDYVDFVEKQLLTSLTTGRLLRPDKLNRVCTITDQLLNNSIYRSFGLHGIPDPDRECITEIQAEGDSLSENAPYTINELYDAINERGIVLNQNIRSITSRFIDVSGNFTEPETPHSFVYNRDTARCVLHTGCGIRRGEHWRLATAIHNRPIFESLPDFSRQVVTEYARNVKGVLADTLWMRLEEFRTSEGPRDSRGGTTYITSEAGIAEPNCFRQEPIWQNRAIVDALGKLGKGMYVGENAVKPSRIAVFIFPLGFTLVPISLLANVSRNSVLLYILITDVLTCIPLLLRGIQLLSIYGNPKRAFTVRITAAVNGSLSETASAEIWAAECRPQNQVRNGGIAFVTLALVFMLGGILADIFARKYAKEHRKRTLEAIYYGKSKENERMLGVWAGKDEAEQGNGNG